MQRAIDLAGKAKGKTFPNPAVGAVVVKCGKVIAEGFHEKAGAPHAEIVALKIAKENSMGANLYITLEPCAHYGKTPPCVKTVLKSGVKKVFIAMKDPNPLVNGRGLRILRKNGIYVQMGTCRKEASELNKEYIARMRGALEKCLPELSKKRA